MSSWGLVEWGRGAWGGPTFGPTAALAVRENVVRVAFSDVVYASDLGDEKDAVRSATFTITEYAQSVGLDGTRARPLRVVLVTIPEEDAGVPADLVGRFVDLTFDRPMTPWPASYKIACSGVWSEDQSTPSPAAEVDVEAVYRELSRPTTNAVHPSRDLANPQTHRGAVSQTETTDHPLGTYAIDDSGDYALDEGVDSFRKRVIRIAVTREGAFAHLPDFGGGLTRASKQLATAARIAGIVSTIEKQVGRDPECRTVSARAVFDRARPGLMRLQLSATTINGQKYNLSVPFLTQ